MKWLARTSRGAIRLMQPLVPRGPRGVTILTYHLVDGGTRSPVDLPIDVFRSQLTELSEFARVLPLGDAVSHLESGLESARPVVVITFDDGFDNFRTRAWPVLREMGLPCTLYVPVGFLLGTHGTPLGGAEGLRPVAPDALRELAADPLLTVGSHSWCHGDMRALSRMDLRQDLRRSREWLEECTGSAVEHFCYPRAKWAKTVEEELRATYRTAVIAGGRRNCSRRFHPLRLGRVPLRRDMPVRLTPIVQSAVWLEEWAARHARSLT